MGNSCVVGNHCALDVTVGVGRIGKARVIDVLKILILTNPEYSWRQLALSGPALGI